MSEFYTLITYFIIYSFFGWILESVYKSILQKKLVNSGFLVGPFCPIYGFGALIMYLSLRNLTNNIFILFVFGMIVLSIFEYIVGWFLEIAFQTKYWDYSNKKFNINGRVCLLNSLYWGVLGIIFMRLIHPFIEVIIEKIPDVYLMIIVCIGMIYILSDTITTMVKIIKINVKLKNLEQLSEKIKDKINAINVKTSVKFEDINRLRRQHKYKVLRKLVEAKDTNKEILGELKLRQQENHLKLEKKLRRLQKAFPNMKSDRLASFWDNYKKS